MNKHLQKFARNTLLDWLSELPEENHLIFKRMYSHDNLEASIEDVVKNMSVDKLDWAMQQVEITLNKRAIK